MHPKFGFDLPPDSRKYVLFFHLLVEACLIWQDKTTRFRKMCTILPSIGCCDEVILCKGLVKNSDPVVLSLLNFVFSPNSLSLFSISFKEKYSLASCFSKGKNRIQPINIEPPTKQLRIQNK